MTLARYPEIQLAGWGGCLNGIWEFAHSTLYTDHGKGLWYVIWTRLHCTIGDLMILLFSFWLTSLVFRTRGWIYRRQWIALLCFFALGLGYTVFSEWYNTTVTKTWQYAAAMPLLWGIGVSPILQWVVIPPSVAVIMRTWLANDRKSESQPTRC